jgi:HlyD family secretion protein
MIRILLILLLVGAAGGGAAWYYAQAQGNGGLDIQTVEVKRGELRRVVATSGAVRALGTVEVGSQLSGQIGELNVDFSSEVKGGDVLARIEPSTFETRVREAEAGVALAEAGITVQEATIVRAEANLVKAKADLSRSQQLVQRGVTTEAAQDAAIAAEQAAAADVAIARAQLENARATLLQRQATLDSARIDLDRTFIRAPIDGVIIARTTEIGQTVAASLQAPILFTIAQDLTRVQIDAQVDEADIGQVAQGNPVSFTVDAYPELEFTGAVSQIRLAPTALANVVTYTVVIDAENPMQRLLPGMTANVEIETGAREDVLLVANEALRFQPRGAAERLVEGGVERDERRGGRRGDRGQRMLDRLRSELKLDDATYEKAAEAIQTTLASFRAERQAAGGPPGDDQREQVRARMAAALRGVLSAEQYRGYEEMQRLAPTGPRRATVYVLEQNGNLRAQDVRLGLADGAATEIVAGLEPGARVVVRVREGAAS